MMNLKEYIDTNPSINLAFLPMDELLSWYEVEGDGFSKNYIFGAVTARVLLLSQENINYASKLIEKITQPELRIACESALNVGVMNYRH